MFSLNNEFLPKFREKLYAEDALQNVEALSVELFNAYSASHQPGQIVGRMALTEAGSYLMASSDWSGTTDEEVWSSCKDQMSDEDILDLMRAWVPSK